VAVHQTSNPVCRIAARLGELVGESPSDLPVPLSAAIASAASILRPPPVGTTASLTVLFWHHG
jgi:hypothetical protein